MGEVTFFHAGLDTSRTPLTPDYSHVIQHLLRFATLGMAKQAVGHDKAEVFPSIDTDEPCAVALLFKGDDAAVLEREIGQLAAES